MKIQLSKNDKIYIMCPAKVKSGGPELLHQIGYVLRKIYKVKVYMLYYPRTSENPVNASYDSYNLPYIYCNDVEDNIGNILIIPEIKPSLDLSSRFKKIRKCIWFLSVDNYYLFKMKKTDFFLKRFINELSGVVLNRPIYELSLEKLIKRYPIEADCNIKKGNYFFTNSYRGFLFLKEKEIYPLFYLSEYLNEAFLNTKYYFNKKENIITYNPSKGFPFTRKIIKNAKGLKFIPLIDMDRSEIIKLLQKSKVYIDFGDHPGKDRLPREAAIMGCCVITGRRGSAAFFEDVPILDEYKFDDKIENINKIIEKIKDCFENYPERYKDFDYYREIIKQEPKKFIEDIKNIFILQ